MDKWLEEAKQKAPCTLLLDNLDLVLGPENEVSTSVDLADNSYRLRPTLPSLLSTSRSSLAPSRCQLAYLFLRLLLDQQDCILYSRPSISSVTRSRFHHRNKKLVGRSSRQSSLPRLSLRYAAPQTMEKTS